MQHNFKFRGLSESEVTSIRKTSGWNADEARGTSSLSVLKEIVLEPMFILLVVAASIYFVLNEIREGFFMVFAVLIVSAISFFQDRRSRIVLEDLKKISSVKAKVLRDGIVTEVDTKEIVPGDFVVVEEGSLVPADGNVVQCNDFTVNESILTGESFAVAKSQDEPERDQLFQGTVAVSGLALMKVTAIGKDTRFAKIGKSVVEIKEEESPLQVQIRRFVRGMAFAGAFVFLAVWAVNFYISGDILDSLVKGLTLAMSVLPEEIPVAFSTFMAIGAWRLMQKGIVVKKIKTVETLGAANVICVDKTGTITENRMALAEAFIPGHGSVTDNLDSPDQRHSHLIELAMWASEPVPFDPMEKAIHDAYGKLNSNDQRSRAQMVHEYALSGRPPLMTHVFSIDDRLIIAAKGSPERLLQQSDINADRKATLDLEWRAMANKGLRVLGVGQARWSGPLPEEQDEFRFQFAGFIGFYDPPKSNIPEVIAGFHKAGIEVKILTGDSPQTTTYIAKKIGLATEGREVVTGESLMNLNDDQLRDVVSRSNIFVRMFPEAKLRIINMLKQMQQVVGMTGDGVNDGPALKAAHIGIAMGRQGSEIARQASALILIDGDLSKMVEAVAMGRKIYINLKRAIQYIISIHIPIVLMVSLPLFLGLQYPFIFTPVHVIFLEVIMGPTCSIVYENEPFDERIMSQPPRKVTSSFFEWHELRISIIQGIVIAFVLLAVYLIAAGKGDSETTVRTLVFLTLIFANVFLTIANRSVSDSFIQSIRKKNSLMVFAVVASIAITAIILFVPFFREIFQVEQPDIKSIAWCVVAAFSSVIWIDIYKWRMRAQQGK